MRDLMTSTEVAERLGVGRSSVKRWADAGSLPCVRTPGGHRRFLHEEVERFMAPGPQQMAPQGPPDPEAGAWLNRFLAGKGAFELRMALARDFKRTGDWRPVAESISLALGEVGRRWHAGDLSVIEEHAASESLARALARASESIAVPRGAPTCLLIAAEGEEHTLGLSLGELIARSRGWETRWVGRGAPTGEVIGLMEGHIVDLVIVAALRSDGSERAVPDPSAVAAQLLAAAERTQVPLILAGSAPWPAPAGEVPAALAPDFETFERALERFACR